MRSETIANAHEACCSVLGEPTVRILTQGRFTLPRICRMAMEELFMRKSSPDGIDYLAIWQFMKEFGS